jgi:hypothetical protein
MFSSCVSSHKIDSFQLAKDFYQKAKSKEKEVEIFFNITAQARGLDPLDSTYRITRIEMKINDSIDLTIPGIKSYMNDEQISKLPFYENIATFGKYYNLSNQQAQDTVKNLSIEIIGLMNELKAYKVVGNPQGNGRFIIFSITSDYDVIYVPNTGDINHKYWKAYFATNNKFDTHWYYRKNK